MGKMEKVRDMLCEELDKMAEEGKIANSTSLDQIDKLTHSIKSIDTIMAMESARDGEASYARGRDRRTGRYVSRDDGYSMRYYQEYPEYRYRDDWDRR